MMRPVFPVKLRDRFLVKADFGSRPPALERRSSKQHREKK